VEKRLHQVDSRSMLVHTPAYASWFNRVEISFSIIQPKVLRPNDFADLEAVRLRLAWYKELSTRHPTPFQWKFDRTKLLARLVKIEAYQQCLAEARCISNRGLSNTPDLAQTVQCSNTKSFRKGWIVENRIDKIIGANTEIYRHLSQGN
jgi:hypothetical protein